MRRQANNESQPVVIGFKQRGWRAICSHGLENFGYAGRAAFRQLQLLQKLANPAVAVPAADRAARFKIAGFYGAIRPWEAQDHQLVVTDTHLNRFTHLIRAVVNRINQRLLDRDIRKVPNPRRLRPVRVLHDRFNQIVALYKAQRIAQHARQRPFENLFIKSVAPGPFGKPHHINLRVREKALGRLAEEQQPHILGPGCFCGAIHHMHLPPQLFHRHLRRVKRQGAAHLGQIRQHQRLGHIADLRVLGQPVVPRHLRRQAQQFLLHIALGFYRAAVAANVVVPGFGFGSDGGRRFVRPVLPARCPQHQQVTALHHLHAQHREVGRLYQLARRQQLLLNLVELVRGQARGRENGLSVGIAILADDHIAATQVFKVVGKRAQRAEDGVRVPARLVLNALALHRALAQQVLQVDGELVRHGRHCQRSQPRPGLCR